MSLVEFKIPDETLLAQKAEKTRDGTIWIDRSAFRVSHDVNCFHFQLGSGCVQDGIPPPLPEEFEKSLIQEPHAAPLGLFDEVWISQQSNHPESR